MTVATNPLSKVEENKEQDHEQDHAYGLVRGTTKVVAGLYGQVKNCAPIIKTSFERVESRIPTEWVDYVTTKSEPIIDKVDNELDRQLDRVVPKVNQLQNVTLSDVTGAVVAVPSKVIAATGVKVGQWKSIRGDLSKKAVVRIEKGLAAAREYSATRGKEILHFDLIDYSEKVLDNASAVAKPIYEPLQKNLAAAVIKLNTAMTSLQETAAKKSADLHSRLQDAIVAARELSKTSVAYVRGKYNIISSQLPDEQQVQALAGNLPFPVRDALKFILHSPQLFLEVKAKADINSSKRTVENVNNLMGAVKEVVFSQGVQGGAEIEGAKEAPAAEMEDAKEAPAAEDATPESLP